MVDLTPSPRVDSRRAGSLSFLGFSAVGRAPFLDRIQDPSGKRVDARPAVGAAQRNLLPPKGPEAVRNVGRHLVTHVF